MFFCGNCGNTYEMNLPAPIKVVTAAMSAFAEQHSNCEKTWKEPIPEPGMSEKDRAAFWLENGERGISSETMFGVLSGSGRTPKSGPRPPYDPDDFRRCHLLLETVPQWRNRLDELKVLGDAWPSLVDNWDKLTFMLLEQTATGKCGDMYEFMKELGC